MIIDRGSNNWPVIRFLTRGRRIDQGSKDPKPPPHAVKTGNVAARRRTASDGALCRCNGRYQTTSAKRLTSVQLIVIANDPWSTDAIDPWSADAIYPWPAQPSWSRLGLAQGQSMRASAPAAGLLSRVGPGTFAVSNPQRGAVKPRLVIMRPPRRARPAWNS